jgi:hypothetical protein
MRFFIAILFCVVHAYSIFANNKDFIQNLNIKSMSFVNYYSIKKDTIAFKMPKYKQGKFCDFEDKIQRKKVPLNFNLGNSKY